MKNLLVIVSLLFFYSCNNRPSSDSVADKSLQTNPVQSSAHLALQKMNSIETIAYQLLKKSPDPRSREIEELLAGTSGSWFVRLDNCETVQSAVFRANQRLTFLVMDQASLNIIAKDCPDMVRNFGSVNSTMLFIAPSYDQSHDAPVFIMVKWEQLFEKNDTLNALACIHELFHALQWAKNPQQLAARNAGAFRRECDAWDYQSHVWFTSLSDQKKHILKAKIKAYEHLPEKLHDGTGIEQVDADEFTQLFGDYKWYWDMFLVLTFHDEYVKSTYKGLQK